MKEYDLKKGKVVCVLALHWSLYLVSWVRGYCKLPKSSLSKSAFLLCFHFSGNIHDSNFILFFVFILWAGCDAQRPCIKSNSFYFSFHGIHTQFQQGVKEVKFEAKYNNVNIWYLNNWYVTWLSTKILLYHHKCSKMKLLNFLLNFIVLCFRKSNQGR